MMKAIGVVRRIDPLGRLVIPKELRLALGIEQNAPIEIFVDEDRIILKQYTPACVFCDCIERVVEYQGHKVCQKCFENLQEIFLHNP